jgi:hypothetical protein
MGHASLNKKVTMNFFCKLFLALALCASATAHAEGSSGAGTVNLVYFYEGHTGALITHSNQINPDGCASAAHFLLSDTYVKYKEVYALLLAANLSGKKVSISVSGCLQGFPLIKHVALYRE